VIPPELYGPFGALVLLALAVGALWRSHEKQDALTSARLDAALKGWADQTAATLGLTNVIEKGDRAQAAAMTKLVNVLRDQAQPNVLKGQISPEDQP
jgi:lysophospholipid acyltransferase (LPLAT)-like uncharacterized protein